MQIPSRRFGDFTYEEIRTCAEQGWLAVIPTGCTEQQGPHLSVDFDTWFAERLMLAAAEKAAQSYTVQALVLPATSFGPTPEHRQFGSGFIDVPLSVHNALIEAILTSLATQGFQRMVLWRGCGGHNLAAVTNRFNQDHQGTSHVFRPPHPFHEIWCRLADPAVNDVQTDGRCGLTSDGQVARPLDEGSLHLRASSSVGSESLVCTCEREARNTPSVYLSPLKGLSFKGT